MEKRYSLGSVAISEGVFGLVIVGGVIEIARAVLMLFIDVVTLDVGVMAQNETAVSGYELHRDAGELRLLDASFGERLLAGLPHLLIGATVVVVGVLLLKVARTARAGTPFIAANARRLTVAGAVAGLGGMASVVAGAWGEAAISGNAPEELNVVMGASFSFAPVLVAVVLLALADVFRRGVVMREELDEVI